MPASRSTSGSSGARRERPGDVGAGAGQIVLPPGERGGEIPGEGISGDQLQRAVDLGAGGGGVVRGHPDAGAIEMDLAPQFVRQVRGEQGRVEGPQRLRIVPRGEPGIAGLDPEIGAARFPRAFRLARRLFESDAGLGPAFERGQSEPEAGVGVDASTFASRRSAAPSRAFGIRADLLGAGR